MALRVGVAAVLLTVAVAAGCGGAGSPATTRPPATQVSPPATAVSETTSRPRCPGSFVGFHTDAGWYRARVATIAVADGCRSWLHLTNPSGATATAPIRGSLPDESDVSPFAAPLVGVTELSGEPVIVVVAREGASNDFPELFTIVDGNLRAISVPSRDVLTWGGTVEDLSQLGCDRRGALVQSGAGWTGSRWTIQRFWLVLSGLRLELVGARQATEASRPNTETPEPPGAEWSQKPLAGCPRLSRFLKNTF